MVNNFVSSGHAGFLLVFAEGLLSFFSPCVLPLIPVYISYLAGNAKRTDENGVISYERKKVFLHTIFFVLGISFAFFVLGLSFSALGSFFTANKMLFTRIGGILIILLGLYQLGFLEVKGLEHEHRLPFKIKLQNMNPIIAFALGFTFSFAWTPCVGPALSSVLIMSSGAKNIFTGNLLVLVYALGFVLPFLALGLFTTQVLDFIKTRQKLLRYTIKAGGVLLIIMGIMTFTGWMNGISGYLSSIGGGPSKSEATSQQSVAPEASKSEAQNGNTSGEAPKRKTIPAPDFTLNDQNGVSHTLSSYKGKVVFLNFWTTWCGFCKSEIPYIDELYKEYGENKGDVVFLGVVNPQTDKKPQNADVTSDEIKKFISDNAYSFPSVFDETKDIYTKYSIGSLPTTYMIDTDGNIYGYVAGGMDKERMENIIKETLESKK